MPLSGADDLIRRLNALHDLPLIVGRRWADETVKAAKRRLPASIAATVVVGQVTRRGSQVRGGYKTSFIEKGAKPHVETARGAKAMKFSRGSRTVFAKRVMHPRVAAHPFKEAAAREGLAKADPGGKMVELWNRGR